MLCSRYPFSRPVLLAGLCGCIAGCGLTSRNESDPIPDAGIDPEDPCVAQPPLTEPAENCAYPVASMVQLPQAQSVESLQNPDCRQYRLGDAIELPFEQGARYAFSLDVNGDSVADVFFRRSDDGLGLLESRVSGGRVSYEPASCIPMPVDEYPSLRASSTIRFFARDINHDSVPDLVVGHGNAFWAFVNLPGGFVEVMHHRASDDARVGQMSFPSMATGDFDGDGHCIADLALGYDAALGTITEADGIEVGVLLLQARGTWPEIRYEARRWASQLEFSGGTDLDLEYSGHAAATLGSDTAQLFIQGRPRETLLHGLMLAWNGGMLEELPVELEPSSGTRQPWIIPFGGKSSALAIQQASELVLYDLSDPATMRLPVLWRHPSLGQVFVDDHEGGGGWVAPPSFMIDIEGDGDLDFIEGTRTGHYEGPRRIVIHRNEDGTRFAEGVAVELPDGYDIHGAGEEHPFVAAGGARGAFLIGASSGPADPPVLWPIECVP